MTITMQRGYIILIVGAALLISGKLNPPKFDIYEVMSEYNLSLYDKFQDNTRNNRISTVRNFLEVNDVTISPAKWRLNVTVEKKGKIEKTPIEVNDVRKIILGCNHPRLRAFVHTLAATGCRSGELASVLVKHVDLDNATMYFRAEFTKTKVARTIFLTNECVNELKKWVEYRRRVRTIVSRKGRTITHRQVEFKPDDLFFSTGRHDEIEKLNPAYMRNQISEDFFNAMEQMGLGEMRELDDRHKVTFHTFRAFVKTTISNLGYQDYSEWFIGHAGSTYWDATTEKKLEIFHKIEPYLTYLDYSDLEAQGADTQTQLEEAQKEIAELKKQISNFKYKDAQVEQIQNEFKIFKEGVKKQLEEYISNSRLTSGN